MRPVGMLRTTSSLFHQNTLQLDITICANTTTATHFRIATTASLVAAVTSILTLAEPCFVNNYYQARFGGRMSNSSA